MPSRSHAYSSPSPIETVDNVRPNSLLPRCHTACVAVTSPEPPTERTPPAGPAPSPLWAGALLGIVAAASGLAVARLTSFSQAYYISDTWKVRDNLTINSVIFNGDINAIRLPGDQRSVSRWFNTEAGFERNSAQQLDMIIVGAVELEV